MLRRVCVYCALFCAAEINQASMSAIRNYAYYFTFSCGEAEVTLGVRLWTNHGSRGRLDNLGEDVGVRELGGEVSHVLIVHEATEEDIVPAGQDLVWRHLVRYSIDNKYSDLDTISLNVGVNLSRGNKDCLPGLECVHIQQQGSQAAGVA